MKTIIQLEECNKLDMALHNTSRNAEYLISCSPSVNFSDEIDSRLDFILRIHTHTHYYNYCAETVAAYVSSVYVCVCKCVCLCLCVCVCLYYI